MPKPAGRVFPFPLPAVGIGLIFLVSACGQQPVPAPPRLAVILVVDGLSQEQLLSHRAHYTAGGLRRFLEEGARFTDAHYDHAGTLTASGHATILTGANPSLHGLVGNEWRDSQTGEMVYSVEDPRYHYLDEPSGVHAGTSPANLRVGTLGDQLRLAAPSGSRVLAISGKDRSSIIAAGKEGTAYFFSSHSGRFVTTTYYMKSYPAWWNRFHANRPQDHWFGSSWEPLLQETQYDPSVPDGRAQHVGVHGLGTSFPHPLDGGADQIGPHYYEALIRTPYGNDHTLAFARAAIEGEQMGERNGPLPDLLVVSLSSQDHVNHLYGPESRQAQDHLIRLDRSLSQFLAFLDERLGRSNTALVLTSDHGFPNTPEDCQRKGLDAGRMDSEEMLLRLNEFLSQRFGAGRYAVAWFNPTIYLDPALMVERNLDASLLESAAAEFLISYPGVEMVFTRTQLETGTLPSSPMAQQARLSWDSERSGHLFVVQKHCWYLLRKPRALASTHGSPHAYDTHVPLIFLGRWVKAGEYPSRARIVDLAPTLARILGVSPPDDGSQQVMEQILAYHTVSQ